MPDIPRDFLHASPRFSTPEQEWRVPGQAVLKSNDHGILRLYFLEAHQRLTKYLPRSSSTLQKGGDVPRFKRNRVHLCKKKKKGREGGRFRFVEIFCIKSRTRIGLWRVSVSDSLISVIARGGSRNLEGKEGEKRGERFLPFSASLRDVKRHCPNCQRTKVKHVLGFFFLPRNYNDGVPLLLFLAVAEEETSWILENFENSICDIILGKISGDVMLNSKIILYWIEIWNYRLCLVWCCIELQRFSTLWFILF